MHGNDADLSALLIALLRGQGAPARYVQGTKHVEPRKKYYHGVSPGPQRLEQARAIVRRAPEDGIHRYTLGSKLMEAGQRADGREELLRAAELLGPEDSTRYGWLAAQVLCEDGFGSMVARLHACAVAIRRASAHAATVRGPRSAGEPCRLARQRGTAAAANSTITKAEKNGARPMAKSATGDGPPPRTRKRTALQSRKGNGTRSAVRNSAEAPAVTITRRRTPWAAGEAPTALMDSPGLTRRTA